MPQVVFFNLIDIDPVVTNLAVLHIIKAVDQIGDRCFPGAGGSHKGNLLPRPCIYLNIVQNLLFLRIAKIHMVKYHIPLHELVGGGIVRLMVMLPRPDSRPL